MPGNQPEISSAIGVVIIGRNEGDRLRRCLASGVSETPYVFYVDSGSADDSVNIAKSAGVEVIELDPSTPFSAARARNEGYMQLRQAHPDLQYCQFIDGDCEMHSGWLRQAAGFLDAHPEIAVVSGRLRERYPERSIYNMLCDIEWDVPAGAAQSCGGISMMRLSALQAAKGFRIDLIAGEEPELCIRLRAQGWKIWRVDREMAMHDAAMSRFGQWWKRTQRAGYAIAQGASLHGAPPEQYGIRELRSMWFWGLLVPLLALGLTAIVGPVALSLLLVLYCLQVVRLALSGTRSSGTNWLNAAFLVMGKFPAMLGLLRFHVRRALGQQPRLIEYK